jgi:TolB-like protein
MNRHKTQHSFLTPFSLSQLATFVILIITIFFNSGCSSFNGTRLEGLLGGNTNLIKLSYTIADHLAERSLPPLVPHHPNMPILVTTFVDNNDLQKTSHLGRVLQEHIASRLVQLGYTVREMKITSTLHMEEKSGETILSRDLSKLSEGQEVQAILAGTISRTERILYISARLINPVNNNIIATDDYQIYMDDNMLAMFGLRRQNEYDKPIEEPRQPFLNSIL